ncbi:MAG: AGE family epimerase/isomerase [Bifidobacteriaceae bacterium]|jgi:mannobiose 2-epimerase|nr:AGE family epimerase/isomerase [Bifidobacteriaceae bacterium]
MLTLRASIESELVGRIIPFWQTLRDDRRGGYFGHMDWDLVLRPGADKATVLTSRILWLFSTAAANLGRPDLLEEARHAYRFLVRHCFDPADGAVIWSVRPDGTWSDTTKQAYAQAFAIFGLAAYHEASGETEPLEIATGLFDLLEGAFLTPTGYTEALDRDLRPAANDKLSENGVLASRTMNTLLHVFEAYCGLLMAGGDRPRLERSIRWILDVFANQVYNPQARRLDVFFDSDMRPLLDMQSFGHDIEAAWMFGWGVALLDDPGLARTFEAISTDLVASVHSRAYRSGALAFESVCGEVNTRRHWWVQAEGMVSFQAAAAKADGGLASEYRLVAEQLWRYLEGHFFDARPGGEWYWEVDVDGRPVPGLPVVSAWKCPYHSGRACLKMMAELGALEPSYVAR